MHESQSRSLYMCTPLFSLCLLGPAPPLVLSLTLEGFSLLLSRRSLSWLTDPRPHPRISNPLKERAAVMNPASLKRHAVSLHLSVALYGRRPVHLPLLTPMSRRAYPLTEGVAALPFLTAFLGISMYLSLSWGFACLLSICAHVLRFCPIPPLFSDFR